MQILKSAQIIRTCSCCVRQRPITILSKVFELCICDKFGEFLYSHPQHLASRRELGVKMLSLLCSRQLSISQSVVAQFLSPLWMQAKLLIESVM